MDITKLKVQELRKELKARGLSVSGIKNDLLKRLEMAQKNKLDDTMCAELVDDIDEDLLSEEDDEHIDDEECALSDLDSPADAPSPIMKVEKRKTSDADMEARKPFKIIVLNRNVSSGDKKSEKESIVDKTVEELKRARSIKKVITMSESSSTEKLDIVVYKNVACSDEKFKSESIANKTVVADKGAGGEKRVIKLSELSAKERLAMRAKKFGLPVLGDVKSMVRAERFSVQSKQGAQKTPIKITPSDPATIQSLKDRAQRFGVSVSTALMELENQERMEKRKKRFGLDADSQNCTPIDKAQNSSKSP